MHSNLSDDQISNDVSDFVYNGTDMLINSINDDKIAQLAAAGPTGMAAAAAIASCHKGKKNFEFETNPALRKRLQTRLLRKLRITLNEYSVRIGQQAAIVLYKPSKPPSTNSLKIFGSQPLEDVLKSWSMALISDIEKAFPLILSGQRSQYESQSSLPHQYELPPFVVDGIPTPLDKMTQGQLRGFIPYMLKYATGRGKPGWGRQNMMPVWWPKHIPWANVRADIRSEEQKQKVSWTEALKEIIRNCYAYYGRIDLIDSVNVRYDLSRHNPATSNSTASYLDVGPGEGNDFSLLSNSSVNIIDSELEPSNGSENYLINHNELLSPNFVSTFDTGIKQSSELPGTGQKIEILKKGKHPLPANENDSSEDLILDLSSLNSTSESCFGNRNKRSKKLPLQQSPINDELKASSTSLQHEIPNSSSPSSLYTIESNRNIPTFTYVDQNNINDKDPPIPFKITDLSNQTLCALINDKHRINQLLMQKVALGNNQFISRCNSDELRHLLPTINDNFNGQLRDGEANVVPLPLLAINNQDGKHGINLNLNSLVGIGYGINDHPNLSMILNVNTLNTIDGSLPITFINTNIEGNGNDEDKLNSESMSFPNLVSSKSNEAQPPQYISNINHLMLNNLLVLDGDGKPCIILNPKATNTCVSSSKIESDNKMTHVSCDLQNMSDYNYVACQNPSNEEQDNQQNHQLKCDEFVEA